VAKLLAARSALVLLLLSCAQPQQQVQQTLSPLYPYERESLLCGDGTVWLWDGASDPCVGHQALAGWAITPSCSDGSPFRPAAPLNFCDTHGGAKAMVDKPAVLIPEIGTTGLCRDGSNVTGEPRAACAARQSSLLAATTTYTMLCKDSRRFAVNNIADIPVLCQQKGGLDRITGYREVALCRSGHIELSTVSGSCKSYGGVWGVTVGRPNAICKTLRVSYMPDPVGYCEYNDGILVYVGP
jgi:hypothetical protein